VILNDTVGQFSVGGDITLAKQLGEVVYTGRHYIGSQIRPLQKIETEAKEYDLLFYVSDEFMSEAVRWLKRRLVKIEGPRKVYLGIDHSERTLAKLRSWSDPSYAKLLAESVDAMVFFSERNPAARRFAGLGFGDKIIGHNLAFWDEARKLRYDAMDTPVSPGDYYVAMGRFATWKQQRDIIRNWDRYDYGHVVFLGLQRTMASYQFYRNEIAKRVGDIGMPSGMTKGPISIVGGQFNANRPKTVALVRNSKGAIYSNTWEPDEYGVVFEYVSFEALEMGTRLILPDWYADQHGLKEFAAMDLEGQRDYVREHHSVEAFLSRVTAG